MVDLPLVTIPKDLQSEDNFFRFRFNDSRKIHLGTLIDVKDCLVSSYDPKLGRHRNFTYDEYREKYAAIHHKNKDYRSATSSCITCGQTAQFILLWKYTGCTIRQKYCSSCIEKKILKISSDNKD